MQYIYIHGFGTTGAGSTKFKKIKAHAASKKAKAIALEWHALQPDIVKELLQQIDSQVDWTQPVCFIGSSTGGNFTWQLLERLNLKKLPMPFVLINPLVNITQRKMDNPDFPVALAQQLKDPSDELSGGLVLLGQQDELLDPAYSARILGQRNHIVTGTDWNHTLSNLDTDSFLNYIDLAAANRVPGQSHN